VGESEVEKKISEQAERDVAKQLHREIEKRNEYEVYEQWQYEMQKDLMKLSQKRLHSNSSHHQSTLSLSSSSCIPTLPISSSTTKTISRLQLLLSRSCPKRVSNTATAEEIAIATSLQNSRKLVEKGPVTTRKSFCKGSPSPENIRVPLFSLSCAGSSSVNIFPRPVSGNPGALRWILPSRNQRELSESQPRFKKKTGIRILSERSENRNN